MLSFGWVAGEETERLEIHSILYKPAVPAKVRAAARTMKTMGFKHLCLIDPCDHLGDDFRMLDHGSHDIPLYLSVI